MHKTVLPMRVRSDNASRATQAGPSPSLLAIMLGDESIRNHATVAQQDSFTGSSRSSVWLLLLTASVVGGVAEWQIFRGPSGGKHRNKSSRRPVRRLSEYTFSMAALSSSPSWAPSSAATPRQALRSGPMGTSSATSAGGLTFGVSYAVEAEEGARMLCHGASPHPLPALLLPAALGSRVRSRLQGPPGAGGHPGPPRPPHRSRPGGTPKTLPGAWPSPTECSAARLTFNGSPKGISGEASLARAASCNGVAGGRPSTARDPRSCI